MTTPQLVLALAWFDEPIPFLERCVTSAEGLFDTVVAFDGRWEHMPGEADLSAPEQADALTAAAELAGITPVVKRRAWQSQVVKRSALMTEAARHGDWILVIDADEYITDVDASALRRQLRQTELDVASIHCTRYCKPSPPRQRVIRRFFRASVGVTVQRWHNGYVTPDGRWLHGPGRKVEREDCLALQSVFRITHEMRARGKRRDLAMRAYYAARAQKRLEV